MKYFYITAGLISLTVLSNGYAEQKLEKKLTLQQFYSDNMNLLPRELKQSENVTEIYPQLLYTHKRKNHLFEGHYALQALHYGHGTRDDKIFQRGFLRYETPNRPKRFHLESYARLTQEVIFPEVSSFKDVLTDKNSDIFSFLIQPTFAHFLGQSYKAKYIFSHGQVHYLNEPVAANRDYRMRISAVPQKNRNMAEWSGSVEERWTYIGSDLNLHDEHADVFINAPMTPKFNLLGQAGYQNYHQEGIYKQVEGFKLLGGVEWAMTRLTQVKMLWGRQAYGKSGEFQVSTRTKNHEFKIHYYEQVENSARQNLRTLPEVTPQNLIRRGTEYNPTVSNSLFIARLNEAEWIGLIGKTDTHINLFYNRHQLLQNNETERDYGANVALKKRIADANQAEFNLGYAQHRYFDTQRDRRNFAGMILSRDFAHHLKASIYANKFRSKNTFLDINTQENTVGVKIEYQRE